MLLLVQQSSAQVNINIGYTVAGNGCVGDLVQFVNTTSGATSYEWDFGDGSPTSNLPAPAHIYTFSGSFDITLTAWDQSGDTATSTLALVLYPQASATFFADINPVCPGVQFMLAMGGR